MTSPLDHDVTTDHHHVTTSPLIKAQIKCRLAPPDVFSAMFVPCKESAAEGASVGFNPQMDVPKVPGVVLFLAKHFAAFLALDGASH